MSPHTQHHCPGPDTAAPCPTEMPPRSAALATPPSDAWSPRTTTAVVDHDSRQETQKGTRTSGSEPHRGARSRAQTADAASWVLFRVREVSMAKIDQPLCSSVT